MVSRIVYPTNPHQVEYKFTSDGRNLIPLINALGDWWEALDRDGARRQFRRPSFQGGTAQQLGAFDRGIVKAEIDVHDAGTPLDRAATTCAPAIAQQ